MVKNSLGCSLINIEKFQEREMTTKGLKRSACGIHPGCQSITEQHRHTQDKQPCKHPLTPEGNLERPIDPTIMFFRLWEGVGVPGETQHIHGENPRRSRCKATVLPTVPPCSPIVMPLIKI
ncbi:hypothetical protein CHARACLAT_003583 [Characodon lateralis]|uniref:Uncharacterized protein n=1 Tax=Characodon lateralis TaxID=208331 RepID=A0ABU7CUK9_9TELE|nr:hypothetical protein [Characodon lateralis]